MRLSVIDDKSSRRAWPKCRHGPSFPSICGTAAVETHVNPNQHHSSIGHPYHSTYIRLRSITSNSVCQVHPTPPHTPTTMGDPQYAKYPDLQLSQHIFQLSNPSASSSTRQSSLKYVQDAVQKHKMAPLYRHLAHPADGILNLDGEGTAAQPRGSRRYSSGASSLLATRSLSTGVSLPWDEQLYEQLKAENEKELETFQKEEDEATEKAGETEVQAAKGKRAEFWARVGDKVPSPHAVLLWSKLIEYDSRTKQ